MMIERSATAIASASVAVLFVEFVSAKPAGAVMVAVLVRVEPEGLATTVAVRVKVAEPFAKRLTAVLMLPVPLGVAQEPAEATQVQVAPVTLAGRVSATVAPVTAEGPAFDATIV